MKKAMLAAFLLAAPCSQVIQAAAHTITSNAEAREPVAGAQEPIQETPVQVPPVQIAPPLPVLDLKLEDVLDILAEYELLYDHNANFCSSFYGLTNFESRTITLCGTLDMTMKRRALLHEIRHVQYWKRGIYTGGPYETTIESQAEEYFRKLYGLTPISPHTVAPQ